MSTKYLRRFPGKKRFQTVSKDDWEAPMPHRDIGGWGHVLTLEADVRVWAPDGELVAARKWPSRSYIRNFARIMRNLFGESVQMADRLGTLRTVQYNNTGSGFGVMPGLDLETTGNVNQSNNPDMTGAGMAIGQGVPAEDHRRNDLVSRVGGVYVARQNVTTPTLTTATTTLQVTSGITNATAGSIDITEMGMFLFMKVSGGSYSSCVPFSTLLAYDGFSAVPVASGGVIAPRYTMNFPI